MQHVAMQISEKDRLFGELAQMVHLAEISQVVGPGKHAVLLPDQAGWHLSDRVQMPVNITLPPLPPKYPELNPVEKVWTWDR